MLELLKILGGLGALGVGYAIYQSFSKGNAAKHQKELENKVAKNDKKQAHLEGEQAQEDKETQRKVDEIEREKSDKPSGSDLADWFNRRK
jgi:hypothetical protein